MKTNSNMESTHRAIGLWYASTVRDRGGLATSALGQGASFQQGWAVPGGRAPLA